MNRDPKDEEPAKRGKNDPGRGRNTWGIVFKDPLRKAALSVLAVLAHQHLKQWLADRGALDADYSIVSKGSMAREEVRGVPGDGLRQALKKKLNSF